MFNSPSLISLLVEERQRTVRRELRAARRWRLRRALATIAYAIAHLVADVAAYLDEERSQETVVEAAA
ncbi:MAG TPA: hypothetical protein VGN14_08160 [Candidatus Elarobacter sp.]